MLIDLTPRDQYPKPTKHNVILLALSEEHITPGGLIIATQVTKNAPPKGLVVAIGPLVDEVLPGEEVLYNRHASKAIEHNNQEYLVVHVEEIFGATRPNDSTTDISA